MLLKVPLTGRVGTGVPAAIRVTETVYTVTYFRSSAVKFAIRTCYRGRALTLCIRYWVGININFISPQVVASRIKYR